MHPTRFAAAALAGAALMTSPAVAQTADDINALRRDMDQLRQDYQARISELEARLAAAEADAAAARAAADAAQAAPTNLPADATVDTTAPLTVDQYASVQPGPSGASATNANAFNPGISVVLNGFLTSADRDTGEERIAGVAAGGEIENPPLGLSLGESEIAFSANIDPYFYGFMVAAIDNAGEVGIEEAYISTTQLPAGLTLTAGRFFSGIGYANEMHAHNWAFSDQALPYRAFVGSQLGDDGVQLTWLAPTDQFWLFGLEAFRGEAYPAAGAENDGIGAYTAFVRTGADIDVSNSYLASLSYLHGNALDRESDGDIFTGDSDLLIGSLTYKWAPGGNRLNRNFTATGEVFLGNETGTFNGVPVDQDRFGWYVQGIYQWMPRWRAGLRYAALSSDDPGAALAGSALDEQGVDPYTVTGLIEWDPSEFSRLRLQYSHDESDLEPNDVLTMQFTVIYGVHGAHRY